MTLATGVRPQTSETEVERKPAAALGKRHCGHPGEVHELRAIPVAAASPRRGEFGPGGLEADRFLRETRRNPDQILDVILTHITKNN